MIHLFRTSDKIKLTAQQMVVMIKLEKQEYQWSQVQ